MLMVISVLTLTMNFRDWHADVSNLRNELYRFQRFSIYRMCLDIEAIAELSHFVV